MSQGKEEMFRIMAEGKKKGYIHISFSEFSLFKQCGHKHLIQKYLGIDEQPPSIHLYFGNAIHEAIEKVFEEQFSTEKRIEYFRTTFRKNMKENMADTPEINDLDDFTAQGENILRILDVNGILEEYEVISVEEPLYEEIFPGYYFKGFIDLVVKHRKTRRVVIIDWKTSTMPWNMYWKNKDLVFKMQMKLYKYFWARKNNMDMTQIDTKYVVLNRLMDKKKPDLGFGPILDVAMTSTMGEIRNSLEELAGVLQSIHINKKFPKAKFVLDMNDEPTQDLDGNYAIDHKSNGCKFCQYKGGKHPLCNGVPEQSETLLKEHGKL